VGTLVLAMAWMHWPVRLPVASLPADLHLPPADPPPTMTLQRVDTGAMHSKAGLSYRGGSLLEGRSFAMAAYLVRHPRGDLLIDAGLGRDAAAHLHRQPALMQALSDLEVHRPLGDQLDAAGYDRDRLTGVLLTHTHWDHVSGLTDLPGMPVWVGGEQGEGFDDVFASLEGVDARRLAFDDGPYLGYPRSHDVFEDGSVVAVPAPGHTSDSLVVFVSLPDDRRFAFVGDIVWQREGLERPAEKPWLAQRLVDADPEGVRSQIGHLAALQARFEEIVFVPAHDARPAETIEHLGPPSPQHAS